MIASSGTTTHAHITHKPIDQANKFNSAMARKVIKR